jgi:predicted transcriptional regulator
VTNNVHKLAEIEEEHLTSEIGKEFTQAFRFETEMFSSVTQALKSLLDIPDSPHMFVCREPMIAGVIPDLLLARIPGEPSFPTRPLTSIEAHILAYIRKEAEISEATLREELHLTAIGASRALKRLERLGFIRRSHGGDTLTCHPNLSDPAEIVAVELKLKRWRQALAQAVKYRTFANRVYVILDGNQSELPSKALEEFKENSVGLILQWRFWLEEIVSAPWLSPQTPERILTIQKVCTPMHAVA